MQLFMPKFLNSQEELNLQHNNKTHVRKHRYTEKISHKLPHNKKITRTQIGKIIFLKIKKKERKKSPLWLMVES